MKKSHEAENRLARQANIRKALIFLMYLCEGDKGIRGYQREKQDPERPMALYTY